MVKKNLIILGVLGVFLLSVFLTASETFAATLTLENNSALAGTQGVIIPMSLASGTGESVIGLNLDVRYDNTKLVFKEITAGPVAIAAKKDVGAVTTSTPGVIRIIVCASLVAPNQNPIADGVVAYLKFDVQSNASAGATTLSIINAAASNPDAQRVSLTTVNGVITITVLNRPPLLDTIIDQTVNEGTNLTFTVSAKDDDLDPLTYTVANRPSGATFAPAILPPSFSWTPSYTQAGVYSGIHFEVSDGRGGVDTQDITITVNDVNRAPQITSGPTANPTPNYTAPAPAPVIVQPQPEPESLPIPDEEEEEEEEEQQYTQPIYVPILIEPPEKKEEKKQEKPQIETKSKSEPKVSSEVISYSESKSENSAKDTYSEERYVEEASSYVEPVPTPSKTYAPYSETKSAPRNESKVAVSPTTVVTAEPKQVKELTEAKQVELKVTAAKNFLNWRLYKLEIEGEKRPYYWQLAEKERLPFGLTLNKKEGTIYGFLWGRQTIAVKLVVIYQDRTTEEVVFKLGLK